MDKNLISIGGKTYCFDIDAITKWCLTSTEQPLKETELNEGYNTNEDGDLVMMSKVVRELKTPNSQDDTIKYDFMKLLLLPLLSISRHEDVQNNFSYMLIFNTLINMKFLIEITD